jgi:ribosomal protein L21E
MNIFQNGQRIVVSEGQYQGRRGEIVGTQEQGAAFLVVVQLDGIAETVLLRAAMLMKERI